MKIYRHVNLSFFLFSQSKLSEIRIWDLSRRITTAHWTAHSGFVRGVSYSPDGERFYSCGEDKFSMLLLIYVIHIHKIVY